MTNTIERPLGIERQQITIGELEDRAYELKEKLLRLCGYMRAPCISVATCRWPTS